MAHITKEYEYKLMQKYPGLRPNDEVLWDSFIMANPSTFTRVWYDMLVGDPAPGPVEKRAMQRNGSYELGQWRVDVVATDGTQWYIIEVKPNALAGAIGQVLAYKALLVEAGFVPPNAQPMIITDQLSPITEQAAALLGILVVVP